MKSQVIFKQKFEIDGGDFINAGDASCQISNLLKEIGIDPEVILRLTVAAYEAEMNVVMYARHGKMELRVTPARIRLDVKDEGPGIEDIGLAMRPGYSTATDEMRELGFGAGMGLPNMKKHADCFRIDSQGGIGTEIKIIMNLNQKNDQ